MSRWIASQGLSRPFLKTFTAFYPDPTDRPWVSEDGSTTENITFGLMGGFRAGRHFRKPSPMDPSLLFLFFRRWYNPELSGQEEKTVMTKKSTILEPEKQNDISGCHHWFPLEMKSKKRGWKLA